MGGCRFHGKADCFPGRQFQIGECVAHEFPMCRHRLRKQRRLLWIAHPRLPQTTPYKHARLAIWERGVLISSWPSCNRSPLARGRIHLRRLSKSGSLKSLARAGQTIHFGGSRPAASPCRATDRRPAPSACHSPPQAALTVASRSAAARHTSSSN